MGRVRDGAALCACALLFAVGAAAAGPYTWADVAKWPDFTTGTWIGGGGPGSPPSGDAPPGTQFLGPRRPMGASGLPLKPEFVAANKARLGARAIGQGSCEPMGVIADSGTAFYFSKDVIIIGGLSDWYNVWRRVYMDGRPHGDAEPSYFGHSVGHWEGDTLVIDTVAIRPEAQIYQGAPVGNTDTHVIERFRLLNPNTLELVKTVENPAVFTHPWTSTRTLTRTTADYYESYCWTDRDATAGTDLTPPR